jgi:ATP-dependent Clp protease ATP-binding subunit ClpC
MFAKFTDRARIVVALSQKEAERLNHDYIGPEHIILGIIAEGSGVANTALHNLDIYFKIIRNGIRRLAPQLTVAGPG